MAKCAWGQVLAKHREKLLESADQYDLLLNRLVDHLQSEQCLQQDQRQLIYDEVQPAGNRMAKLLEIVACEGERTFNELCKALEAFGDREKTDLAKSLRQSLQLEKWLENPVKLIHCSEVGKTIWGLTKFNDELYQACADGEPSVNSCIEVYDVEQFNFKRRLQVPGLGGAIDLSSCEKNKCIYIADGPNSSIHRISNENEITQWSLKDFPYGIAVTAAGNVLVTCGLGGALIMEFTTNGKLTREINLQSDVVHPLHAAELTGDQFVVCHGLIDDPLHRVCIVNSSGNVLQSYGGSPGSGEGQLCVPSTVAVNKAIFVADSLNRRVLVLSYELKLIGEILSDLMCPVRMLFDEHSGRLYLADNSLKIEEKQFVNGQRKTYSIELSEVCLLRN